MTFGGKYFAVGWCAVAKTLVHVWHLSLKLSCTQNRLQRSQYSVQPYSLYLFHIPIPDIPVDRSLADHPPLEDHNPHRSSAAFMQRSVLNSQSLTATRQTWKWEAESFGCLSSTRRGLKFNEKLNSVMRRTLRQWMKALGLCMRLLVCLLGSRAVPIWHTDLSVERSVKIWPKGA